MTDRVGISIIFITFLLYVASVYTFYWKPPWLIDQLIYVLIANPENVSDLNFWYESGVSVLPGHHNERWAVTLPLRLSTLLLAPVFTPGEISSGLIFTVYAFTFLFVCWYLYKAHGRYSAVIFSFIFLIAIHHSKNRATELLADPFAVLYISAALVGYLYWTQSHAKRTLFMIGFIGILSAFAKVHYGAFFILLVLSVFMIRRSILDVIILSAGALTAVCIQVFLVLALYNWEISSYILNSSVEVYLGYLSGGLGVSDNGGQGHALPWIAIFTQPTFLPLVFLLAIFFPINRLGCHYDILQRFAQVFIILIISLASFSNFPANDSYAFPLYVFVPAVFSVHLAKIFEGSSVPTSILIIALGSCIIVGLLSIFYLGSVPDTKVYKSSLAILYLSTFFALPILSNQKRLDGRPLGQILFILTIVGAGLFFHNWKNIENHHWWRSGYKWHYQYFDAIGELALQEADATYVVLSTWPYNPDRLSRERMYVEPGIKSYFSENLNIIPMIGSTDINPIEIVPGVQVVSDFPIEVPGVILTGSVSLSSNPRGFEDAPHAEMLYSYRVE